MNDLQHPPTDEMIAAAKLKSYLEVLSRLDSLEARVTALETSAPTVKIGGKK